MAGGSNVHALFVWVVLATPLLQIADLQGQSEPARAGAFVRVGAGVGKATAVNDQRKWGSSGMLAEVQAGIGGQRRQAMVEVQWQTFPVAGTTYVYALAASQWYLGRRMYVRPTAGVAWATQPRGSPGFSRVYPALGVALGAEFRVAGQWMSYELYFRGGTKVCWTCSRESTHLFGLQILVSFY